MIDMADTDLARGDQAVGSSDAPARLRIDPPSRMKCRCYA